MEQFLLSRLELRKKRLEENLEKAQELLEKYKSGAEILDGDLVRCQITLKQSITNLQMDIAQYVNGNNNNTELLNTILNSQMKAEDIVIELELIMNLFLKTSENKEVGIKTARLPKLELHKFNGDILRWTEFWDRFEVNVHSQNFKPVEKLAYLLGSLEDRAKEAVEGLSVTNDNYNIAIETLKARYGHKDKVIDSHYEALSKIKRCNHDAESCRRNLNLINKHLRVLTSLGENKESNHLRSLIMEKFPDKLLYELNLLKGSNRSVAAIRSTLDIVVSAMERSQVDSDSMPIPSASTEAFHIRTRKFIKGKGLMPRPNNYKTQRRLTESNFNTVSKKARRSCIFCNGDHYNDQCMVVKGVEERRKKLVGRSFKCLSEGHRLAKCTRMMKCYHCKGEHNRALCPKGDHEDAHGATGAQ